MIDCIVIDCTYDVIIVRQFRELYLFYFLELQTFNSNVVTYLDTRCITSMILYKISFFLNI